MMTFAELLKGLRRDAGMTQEELADAARVSARSISDLERGVYPTARKETARRLAEALELHGSIRVAFESAARGVTATTGSLAGVAVSGVAAPTRALPRDITTFTGRAAEIEKIVSAAAKNDAAAIQVIDGMAGIGKTAFAVHAARLVAAGFPDGQIFLALHAHTPGQPPVDAEDALASLLLTIGVARQQVPPGLEARIASWRAHTAGRKFLLLFDDVAGSEQVRPLLPGSSEHLVLITSRRRLAALEDSEAISLDVLPERESVELFVRLAGRPELNAQAGTVAKLARLCGQLPLAVGLLARQFYHHQAWTVGDIARDLLEARNRLELIHAENLSVAAAFDLSYQDLSAQEQRFFRLLGRHPGTDIDPYAAAALANTDLATARRHLRSLYDQHLLSEPAHDRYRFHDLIRQHAQMLTSEAEAEAEAENGLVRLLDFYVYTARAADARLARRPASHEAAAVGTAPAFAPELRNRNDAARWMTAERSNLQAVVDYAAVRNWLDYVIAIPAAMHEFLHSQGHWDQAILLHSAALTAAHAAGDRLAEADALTDLGDMQHMLVDMPAAAETLAKAIKLYRESANEIGEANAFLVLGIVQRLSDHVTASASLTTALTLYRQGRDRFGQANVLHELGHAEAVTEGCEKAADTLNQALQLHRDLDDRVGEAKDLGYLGIVHYLTGAYPDAIASLTRSLELYRELRDRPGEATSLNYLGVTEYLIGEYERAAATLSSALKLFVELGQRLGEANTVNYRGVLSRLAGNYQQAVADHSRALQIYRDLGDPIGEAYALNFLGELHLHAGKCQDAAVPLITALGLAESSGDRFANADILNNLGELALRSGDAHQARARHDEALRLATDIKSPLRRAAALEGLGLCDIADGHATEAKARLGEALAIYRVIGSPKADRVATILRGRGW